GRSGSRRPSCSGVAAGSPPHSGGTEGGRAASQGRLAQAVGRRPGATREPLPDEPRRNSTAAATAHRPIGRRRAPTAAGSPRRAPPRASRAHASRARWRRRTRLVRRTLRTRLCRGVPAPRGAPHRSAVGPAVPPRRSEAPALATAGQRRTRGHALARWPARTGPGLRPGGRAPARAPRASSCRCRPGPRAPPPDLGQPPAPRSSRPAAPVRSHAPAGAQTRSYLGSPFPLPGRNRTRFRVRVQGAPRCLLRHGEPISSLRNREGGRMSSTELSPADELAPLKDIQKFIWSQGDYSELAKENLPATEALTEALRISPGASLLDVAAGNGNVAISAARRGADVAAVDITPQMVELGRARCAAEGVAVKFSEGDAEDLPFVAGSCDRVSSAFGAMFAPRPERAASEVFRGVRAGGLVGLTAGTPESFIGQL